MKKPEAVVAATVVTVRVPTTTLRWSGDELQQLCVVSEEGREPRHEWVAIPRIVTSKKGK